MKDHARPMIDWDAPERMCPERYWQETIDELLWWQAKAEELRLELKEMRFRLAQLARDAVT